jgi:hypothetical protein
MYLSMDDFLKMDLFFLVTTSVVFLVGLFSLVVLFYVVRILRSADHVMKNVSEESDNVRGDIAILRGKIRDEGMRLRHFGDLFDSVYGRTKAKRKTTHKEKEAE